LGGAGKGEKHGRAWGRKNLKGREKHGPSADQPGVVPGIWRGKLYLFRGRKKSELLGRNCSKRSAEMK